MKNYTLITGGASGLGFDLSKEFALMNHNLFLVSSNQNNLDEAKRKLHEINDKIGIRVLAVDLSDNRNFHLVKEFTNSNEMRINYLVNCAGFGDRCDFKDMDIDKQIRMVELNCNCPMYLMNAYLPDMISQNEGHILNIASIAAFIPGPFMSTYHATKAYLVNISEAIYRELKGTNVHITTICPGPFESGFVEKAHNDYTFKISKVLPSAKIAEISIKMMKKHKMTYIIGFNNRLLMFFTRFVTRKMIINTSAKKLKENV